MLLNMVMFKVTICDFGKMNINMTDKIEKKGMKKMSSKKQKEQIYKTLIEENLITRALCFIA